MKMNNTNSKLDERASDCKPLINAKGGTTSAKKLEGPCLIAAKIEAAAAKLKVENMCLAAIKLKYEGIKPTEKLTKVARWVSDASDRRILSKYLEALEEATKKGNSCAFVPLPRLQRFRINPRVNVSLAHLSERKQLVKSGIDLVMVQGSFAMPSSFVSGNYHIDATNLALFDILMSINALLVCAQDVSTSGSFGLEVFELEDAKADFRAAVQVLRKAARSIQNSIIEVGGLPLREPVLYWREAFPSVTF